MSTSEVHALLVAARETISDPSRWCQGMYAKDALGRRAGIDAPEAIQWCAEGSLLKNDPASDSVLTYAIYALQDAARAMRACNTTIPPHVHINDKRGHAATMEMYARAIAATAPDQEGA